ncbi:MAG TPA: glycosyltransferase family 2 protein [bacterium]|nr:glycosyltransferase family 2 protein [bacterium]HOL46827.1 glycosyltransferase family 2 protein [bacterium]HPQ18647.1 glycosyltransferase family 2 protein [bacterium]
MNNEKIKISIIIPCYNEERRIPKTLDKISFYIQKKEEETDKYLFQIIVIDNNSTDGTINKLKEKQANFNDYLIIIANEYKGKGWAIKKGVLNSDGDIILFTDADLSTPIEELDKALVEIEKNGADIVIASRQHKESQILKRQNYMRETMGKIFNKIMNLILNTGFKDTQCGFKVFKKDVALKLFNLSQIKGFAFDAEIIFLAEKIGYKIVEIPVVWINSKSSKVKMFSDSLNMIIDTLKVRINYQKGIYKL